VWLLHGGSVESILGSGSDVREVIISLMLMLMLMLMKSTIFDSKLQHKDCGITFIIKVISSSIARNVIRVQL
jgi:hypothetical protein